MVYTLKQLRTYGYDVLNNFEPIIRQFILEKILPEYENIDWKELIPKNVITFLSNNRFKNIEDFEDFENVLESIGILQLKFIIVKFYDLVNELVNVLPVQKFAANMNDINRFRIKIMHIKSSFSSLDFKKMVETVREIFNGTYALEFIKYLESKKYLNANDIPKNVFEDFQIPHNLPPEDYDLEGGFVGRLKELDEIMGHIEAKQDRIITISGAGGAGKTAIALKIAYIYLEDENVPFDAILWFSAKRNKLTDRGIVNIDPEISDSVNLIKDITKIIDENIYNTFESSDVPIISWKKHLYNIFESHRSLVFIDNLETINDQDIIKFIINIPRPSKVIITSRKGLGMLERPVPIGDFEKKDAITLFKLICEAKNLPKLLEYGNDKIIELVTKVRCYPLLIKWSIGQYTLGKSIDEAFTEIYSGDSEIAKFSFNDVFSMLSNSSKKILYSLIIFGTENVTKYLIQHLTLLSDEDLEDGIEELIRTSLIFREDKYEGNTTTSYYNLLSLTRGFIRTKLDDDKPIKLILLNRYHDQIKELEKSIAVYRKTVLSLGIKSTEEKIAFNYIKSAKNEIEADNEDEAEEWFKKAVKIAPKLDYVWTEYSKFENLRRNHQNAIEFAKRATKYGPDNFHTWWNCGVILRKNAEYFEAINSLQTAKSLYSEYLPIYSELGLIYFTLGEYENAESEFLQALKEEKKPNLRHKLYTLNLLANNYLMWSKVYKLRQDYDGEIELLHKGEVNIEEALKINPINNYSIKIHRSICLSLGRRYGFLNNNHYLDYLNKAKEKVVFNLSKNYPSKDIIDQVNYLIDKLKNNITISEEITLIPTISSKKNISSDVAMNIMVGILEKSAIEGKPTRSLVIDGFMRKGSENLYNGAKNVIDPRTNTPFKSFTKLLEFFEENKIIEIKIIRGFKEVFLVNQEQDLDNGDIINDPYGPHQPITRKDWLVIINVIIKTFEDGNEDDVFYGRFTTILKQIKILKKMKKIVYSNSRLKNALNEIYKVGFLINLSDGSFRLSKDAKKSINIYIDKLIANQDLT